MYFIQCCVMYLAVHNHYIAWMCYICWLLLAFSSKTADSERQFSDEILCDMTSSNSSNSSNSDVSLHNSPSDYHMNNTLRKGGDSTNSNSNSTSSNTTKDSTRTQVQYHEPLHKIMTQYRRDEEEKGREDVSSTITLGGGGLSSVLVAPSSSSLVPTLVEGRIQTGGNPSQMNTTGFGVESRHLSDTDDQPWSQ